MKTTRKKLIENIGIIGWVISIIGSFCLAVYGRSYYYELSNWSIFSILLSIYIFLVFINIIIDFNNIIIFSGILVLFITLIIILLIINKLQLIKYIFIY